MNDLTEKSESSQIKSWKPAIIIVGVSVLWMVLLGFLMNYFSFFLIAGSILLIISIVAYYNIKKNGGDTNFVKFLILVASVQYMLLGILKLFLASSLAHFLSFMTFFLIYYPLSIRGTINPRTKDKRQWDFLTYLLGVLGMGILMYVSERLFFE